MLALGNIISESVDVRDMVLNAGITDPLVNYIEQFNSRNAIWAFCNLFRGFPVPNMEFCGKYFPFLMKKITTIETLQDIEISEDCLWTLCELTGRVSKITTNNFYRGRFNKVNIYREQGLSICFTSGARVN